MIAGPSHASFDRSAECRTVLVGETLLMSPPRQREDLLDHFGATGTPVNSAPSRNLSPDAEGLAPVHRAERLANGLGYPTLPRQEQLGIQHHSRGSRGGACRNGMETYTSSNPNGPGYLFQETLQQDEGSLLADPSGRFVSLGDDSVHTESGAVASFLDAGNLEKHAASLSREASDPFTFERALLARNNDETNRLGKHPE